ncbi:hypothetical protein ACIA98_36115 [Streptomyces sp. NPDC051366]|uniref:hypothetical protein n=1 Tax=Streptomyces sp. NPDC051366 TaxID=3365652 RepID=UPI0037A43993
MQSIVLHREAEVRCDLNADLPMRAVTAVQRVPNHPLKHLSGQLRAVLLDTEVHGRTGSHVLVERNHPKLIGCVALHSPSRHHLVRQGTITAPVHVTLQAVHSPKVVTLCHES